MTAVSDPELLAFAAELLENYGGLIEPESDRLLALLPPRLARELELSEEVQLGSGGVRPDTGALSEKGGF
jgi:hypothetical protein